MDFDGFGGFQVLAVLESTLPSICLSHEIEHNEATVAVSAVMAVSGMTVTPLKLNPLLLDPDFSQLLSNGPSSFCGKVSQFSPSAHV